MLLDMDVVLVRLYGGRLGAGDEEEPAFLLNLSLLIRLQTTSLKTVLKKGMNHRLHIARSIHRKCQQTHFRLKFMTTSSARLIAVKIRTFRIPHMSIVIICRQRMMQIGFLTNRESKKGYRRLRVCVQAKGLFEYSLSPF